MYEMNRETLIAYSLAARGEYDKMTDLIRRKASVEPLFCDNALTVFDKGYPSRLLELKEAPLVLYYKGDLSLLEEETIGIVGSRKPCDYALKATAALSRVQKDRVIVSGLAKGIDACAQENAARTIGILGCGIDYIYPSVNKDLITRVAKEGLILSEYPGLCPPLGFHFPFRNRIIAALSDTICIMQSSRRSGTMSTLAYALELGREVRVLPYALFDECGRNNNQLIYEGATPISSEDVAF